MTRAPTERAKALVRQFEGYREKAYLCPAQVWTIAYGHTLAVREGQVCSKRQAELWLTEDLGKAAREVERILGASLVAELTDNQHDALCDFVFNLGPQPRAALWARLKARDFDGVPAQLTRFVYSGAIKLAGLVRRRNAEVELWSLDEPGSAEHEAYSAELRVVDTPPAKAAEAPSKAHLAAVGVAACGAVAEGAKTVTNLVQPYADKSDIVQHMLSYAATAGAVAAVAVAALVWIQHRAAKR
jgi:lysozyme